MERYGGGGDRYGNSPETHNYSRHSRAGRSSPLNSDNYPRRSPTNGYRGGGGGRGLGARDYRRTFDSPPRYPSYAGPGGGGVGGFRPTSGGGGGGGGASFGGGFNSNESLPPLAGHKRGYPFSDRRGSSSEPSDGGSFAKLFIGSVPRTITEEDIRPLFEEHGRVLEVALIRDRRTGQQQGCCFIKYATPGEADRAIRALHNQYTLPGGVGPIQVRYADGERERLGAIEYKLFVGALNKQALEKEVEEIFAPYGQVEDVYLMRDDMKQSRGCGFVKYSQREMALAAINALNEIYIMRGCDQPLIVRFADPKRPRTAESRPPPSYGGPGLGPLFPAPGIRPTQNFGDTSHDRVPPNAWQPMSPHKFGQPPDAGSQTFSNQLPNRSSNTAVSSALGSIPGSIGGSVDGFAVSSAPMPQLSLAQVPSGGHQISPLQRPLQSSPNLPSSLQLQPPFVTSFTQTSPASLRPVNQALVPHSSGQNSVNQALPSQEMLALSGHLASQPKVQQNASSSTGQTSFGNNLQPHAISLLANQQQLPVRQQALQHLHQSPSQLAQLLSQQTQTLQASFQSSQQAFSQLQQQLQMMQPSNQGVIPQQSLQSTKQQWPGVVPQTATTTPPFQPGDLPTAKSVTPSVRAMTVTGAPSKCYWTEHTSPDGYKYYHNSSTGESKWEKPEELVLYEQQQQLQRREPAAPVQPLQMQAQPQRQSTLPVSQTQFQVQNQLQMQVQSQIRPAQQLQESSLPSPYEVLGARGYPNPQELSYKQLPAPGGSLSDGLPLQQGQQASQDWISRRGPTGT